MNEPSAKFLGNFFEQNSALLLSLCTGESEVTQLKAKINSFIRCGSIPDVLKKLKSDQKRFSKKLTIKISVEFEQDETLYDQQIEGNAAFLQPLLSELNVVFNFYFVLKLFKVALEGTLKDSAVLSREGSGNLFGRPLSAFNRKSHKYRTVPEFFQKSVQLLLLKGLSINHGSNIFRSLSRRSF